MNALSIFAILFLAIPIAEIYLLIQVGSVIGAFPTIILVVSTAVIGAFLLRQQGISTLQRFQKNMASGQLPAAEMLEGVMLVVGGALLMTPGFFTDTIGFLCLIPFTRRWMAQFMIKKSIVRVAGNTTNTSYQQQTYQDNNAHNTYEGEFVRKEDERINRD